MTLPCFRNRVRGFGVISLVVLALSALAIAPNRGAAQGTLFRWSSGDSGDGGPNIDQPLITDRPDFTEASVTVGQGVAQLETGYTYVSDSENTTSALAHSAPEALLRVGLFADWFEARIAYSYIEERVSEPGVGRETLNGSDDLYLGCKLALTGQAGILPEMALVPQMRVPTGSGEVTAGETLPGANWLYGWDLNDWLAMGGSTQFNRRIDDVTAEPYTEWAQSWTLNYALAEQMGAYTEWFCLAPDGADTNHCENYFDGGLTYRVTDNVQLDVRAGVGLNDAAADMFAGIGLSIRSLALAVN